MTNTADAYAEYAETGHNSEGILERLNLLAQEQISAEREVAQCEEKLKAAQDKLKDIAEKRLPELMDENGFKEFKLSDGTEIAIKETIRVNVSEDNRPKAINWAVAIGKGGVVKQEMSFKFGKGEDERAAKILAAVKSVDPVIAKDASSKKTIAPATMRAMVIECLENGVDVPMDVISIHRQRATEIK
jgi:hypothetical protein